MLPWLFQTICFITLENICPIILYYSSADLYLKKVIFCSKNLYLSVICGHLLGIIIWYAFGQRLYWNGVLRHTQTMHLYKQQHLQKCFHLYFSKDLLFIVMFPPPMLQIGSEVIKQMPWDSNPIIVWRQLSERSGVKRVTVRL